MEGTRFGEWLQSELDRQQIGVKTLARRLAEQHPAGATAQTVESYRTSLRRYLRGSYLPQRAMREAIAAALGVSTDSMPSAEDETEDDQLADLLLTIVEFLRDRGKDATVEAVVYRVLGEVRSREISRAVESFRAAA